MSDNKELKQKIIKYLEIKIDKMFVPILANCKIK